jgi:glycosyltransferase involved in cell wall biosynthesis
MKKLIIQIPCYNEEQTLAAALADLPHEIDGIDKIEWLVIDDGSTDETVNVAKRNGVDHIVSHPTNLGLAKAFMTGLSTCLELGADIVVNTDADNQYRADCIPDLIHPILEGKAEIVVGARSTDEIEDFSPTKKFFQKLGSWTVRLVSGTNIPDSPSGFRAISSSAARQLNVFNKYTYTLETIIQAGQKDIPITWVPIRTNEYMRPSRLVKSVPSYIARSMVTIFRIFVVYKPFRFFMGVGLVLFLIGTVTGLRFLYYFFTESGEGHIQSLILSSILIGIGFQTVMGAFLADLLSVNRRLLEELQYKSRQLENITVKKKRKPEK